MVEPIYIPMKRLVLIGGLVVLVGIVIFLALSNSKDSINTEPSVREGDARELYAHLRCPDDYPTSEDRQVGFQEFVDIYTQNYPQGSNVELMTARRQFYHDHSCVAALQRIADYDAGRVDSETKAIVEEAARRLIEDDKQSDR